MEMLKILCVGAPGASQKEMVINSFRANAPITKASGNTEPVKITAVARGIPRQVMIYDYNTKLTAEENYADSDIVLIFFSANLKDNDSYQQAVKRKYHSTTRGWSWLEEVRTLLPSTPFMFVITEVDKRPPGVRKRDREWVTPRMVEELSLRKRAIATVEVPTGVDALKGEIKPIEELFQLAVVKALEPGVLQIRSCSCPLCCGCRELPWLCCIETFGMACAECFCPGYPGGFQCLRCIPCCRTYSYKGGHDISPSQLRRAKMAREDSIALRKTPCAVFCPWLCCGEYTDYDVNNEFGVLSAFEA